MRWYWERVFGEGKLEGSGKSGSEEVAGLVLVVEELDDAAGPEGGNSLL